MDRRLCFDKLATHHKRSGSSQIDRHDLSKALQSKRLSIRKFFTEGLRTNEINSTRLKPKQGSMRTRLAYLLACSSAFVALAGCAVQPETPSATPATSALPKGVIDASAGKFHQFSGKLDRSASVPIHAMRVITKAHRLQPSKEWSPTIIFCVKNTGSGAAYCLNTYSAGDGTRFVAELLSRESASAELVNSRLPFYLPALESNYLDLVLLRDRLVIIVNDRESLDHPLPAPLDEYWYSCSSIVCSVDIQYPSSPTQVDRQPRQSPAASLEHRPRIKQT